MERAPVTIELQSPVNSYGEMISKITLSSPKGLDILQAGYPWSTAIDPVTRMTVETVNMPALRLLIARMAKIPDSTVDQLDAVDIYRAAETVKFFFHFKTSEKPSNSSSAPADGPATKDLSGT